MAFTKVQTFDGQTPGSTITTANSAASGDAFTFVNIGGNGSATYITPGYRGSGAGRFAAGTTAGLVYGEQLTGNSSVGPIYFRMRFRMPVLPPDATGIRFAVFADSTGAFQADFRLTNAGKLELRTGTSTLVGSSTATYAAGDWVDVGGAVLVFSTTVGQLEMVTYDATGALSQTITSVANVNTTRSGGANKLQAGMIRSGISSFTVDIDDFAQSDLGYPALPAVVNGAATEGSAAAAAPDASAEVDPAAGAATATGSASDASVLIGLPSPYAVVDDFADGTLGPDWDASAGGAQVAESGGTLNVTTTLGTGYYAVSRIPAIDLNEGYVSARLVSAGNLALASYAAYPLAARFSTSNEAFWLIAGGFMACYSNVGGSVAAQGSAAYVPGTHNYFAIGEQGGVLRWLVSADGIGWSALASMAFPFGADTTAQPYFMVGTGGTEATTTTMQVDDLATWGVSAAATAPADPAAAAGAAIDATAAVSTAADTASAAGSAPDATVRIAPSAPEATATGSAPQPAGAVGPTAAVSTGSAAAPDATASTSSTVSASAEVAAGSASAPDASVLVQPAAQPAAAAAAAVDPAAGVAPLSPLATAAATAADPIADVTYPAYAGTATAAASAPDASVRITPGAGSAAASAIAPAATADAVSLVIPHMTVEGGPVAVVATEPGRPALATADTGRVSVATLG